MTFYVTIAVMVCLVLIVAIAAYSAHAEDRKIGR
jgi:hypothetical protein